MKKLGFFMHFFTLLFRNKMYNNNILFNKNTSIFRDRTSEEDIRLKHCNLSTIPKKGAQNQAP